MTLNVSREMGFKIDAYSPIINRLPDEDVISLATVSKEWQVNVLAILKDKAEKNIKNFVAKAELKLDFPEMECINLNELTFSIMERYYAIFEKLKSLTTIERNKLISNNVYNDKSFRVFFRIHRCKKDSTTGEEYSKLKKDFPNIQDIKFLKFIKAPFFKDQNKKIICSMMFDSHLVNFEKNAIEAFKKKVDPKLRIEQIYLVPKAISFIHQGKISKVKALFPIFSLESNDRLNAEISRDQFRNGHIGISKVLDGLDKIKDCDNFNACLMSIVTMLFEQRRKDYLSEAFILMNAIKGEDNFPIHFDALGKIVCIESIEELSDIIEVSKRCISNKYLQDNFLCSLLGIFITFDFIPQAFRVGEHISLEKKSIEMHSMLLNQLVDAKILHKYIVEISKIELSKQIKIFIQAAFFRFKLHNDSSILQLFELMPDCQEKKTFIDEYIKPKNGSLNNHEWVSQNIFLDMRKKGQDMFKVSFVGDLLNKGYTKQAILGINDFNFPEELVVMITIIVTTIFNSCVIEKNLHLLEAILSINNDDVRIVVLEIFIARLMDSKLIELAINTTLKMPKDKRKNSLKTIFSISDERVNVLIEIINSMNDDAEIQDYLLDQFQLINAERQD